MKIVTQKVVSAGNLAGNVTSSTLLVDQVYGFSIQGVVTGSSPNGTLKAQFSCDDVPLDSQVTNWTDISSATVSISAVGTYGFTVTNCFYKWVRFVYARTSGTGAIDINYCAKGA